MPSGLTQRSRAMIAKMHQKSEKKSVFDRLTSNDPSDTVSSTSSPGTSSIFNRLGSYKMVELEKKSIAFSGILKSLPTVKAFDFRLFMTKIVK